ncbi:hypothetical protein QLX67_06810 [Balneolaceae bacterium ANBcel3]|nr:hypothetical protein [Balneolaceae bacterium ANBcel3]
MKYSLHHTTEIKTKLSKRPLRIGIVYDRPEDYDHPEGPPDRFAEFEPDSTIKAMEEAIRYLGHIPLRIGSPHKLLSPPSDVDLIWNIGEGYGTRNREAWAPVLCEMHELPYVGSDALTLSMTLDKALTKEMASHIGIPTTPFSVVPYSSDQKLTLSSDEHLLDTFPLFIKPRYEGTAKGISPLSIISTREQLISSILKLMNEYRQDILVEPFLPGPELTCAVAGYPLIPLPVMERGIHRSGLGSHVPGLKPSDPIQTFDVLSPELESRIAAWSKALSEKMHILDFARFDFKLDAQGNPYFLEVNPLPTFATDSTFAILAELEQKPYPEYLGEILSHAIRRLKTT